MAVIEHSIVYYAKTFAELQSLIECFTSAISSGTLSSFQAVHENQQWTGTIIYRGDFIDTISCIIPVGFLGRIECLYPAELLPPAPLASNYKCWINGVRSDPTSLVLLEATEILRLNFASLPFKAGDKVELSFCNIRLMNVSTRICNSFSKFVVDNQLV